MEVPTVVYIIGILFLIMTFDLVYKFHKEEDIYADDSNADFKWIYLYFGSMFIALLGLLTYKIYKPSEFINIEKRTIGISLLFIFMGFIPAFYNAHGLTKQTDPVSDTRKENVLLRITTSFFLMVCIVSYTVHVIKVESENFTPDNIVFIMLMILYMLPLVKVFKNGQSIGHHSILENLFMPPSKEENDALEVQIKDTLGVTAIIFLIVCVIAILYAVYISSDKLKAKARDLKAKAEVLKTKTTRPFFKPPSNALPMGQSDWV